MMSFLNDQSADLVQLISLPLESVGLALAFVELRTPALADRIESAIDSVERKLLGVVSLDTLQGLVWPFALFGIALVAATFLHYGLSIEIFTPSHGVSLPWAIVLAVFWLGGGVLAAILLFLLPVVALGTALRTIDRYARGRALGGLGLLLSVLGLLGEVYQVLTMFYGVHCVQVIDSEIPLVWPVCVFLTTSQQCRVAERDK